MSRTAAEMLNQQISFAEAEGQGNLSSSGHKLKSGSEMSVRDDIRSMLHLQHQSPPSGLIMQHNASRKAANQYSALYNKHQSGAKGKSINKRTMISVSEMRHHGEGAAALNKTSDQFTFKKSSTGLINEFS